MRPLVLLTLSACAGNVALVPSEFTGRRVAEPAARMTLVADGDDVGEVAVAAGGAFVTALGPQRVRVLHVRLTVDNQDVEPFRLTRTALAVEGVGTGRLHPLAVYVGGVTAVDDALVPQRSRRAVDVVFALPFSVQPDQVGVFRLLWEIELPGERVRGATKFSPLETAPRGVAKSFGAQLQ